MDGAPIEVRRLLKSYDVAMLRWDDEDHRYAIVREILIRGDEVAKHWLEGVLSPAEVREIVRRYAGSGCSEPERARLRSELALTIAELPVRPYIGFQPTAG